MRRCAAPTSGRSRAATSLVVPSSDAGAGLDGRSTCAVQSHDSDVEAGGLTRSTPATHHPDSCRLGAADGLGEDRPVDPPSSVDGAQFRLAAPGARGVPSWPMLGPSFRPVDMSRQRRAVGTGWRPRRCRRPCLPDSAGGALAGGRLRANIRERRRRRPHCQIRDAHRARRAQGPRAGNQSRRHRDAVRLRRRVTRPWSPLGAGFSSPRPGSTRVSNRWSTALCVAGSIRFRGRSWPVFACIRALG